MKGKVAFVYGTILGMSCFAIWYWYPETKGRTFRDIDRLFEMRISPRKFKETILTDEKKADGERSAE
jgi:hypothetical protein